MAQKIRRPTSARRLDAYRVALQLVSFMQPLIARIARHDKDLAHQMRRSLPSIAHNLCEGLRRTGHDRAHLLTVALGSAEELRVGIDIAAAIGILTTDEAQTADQLADRICAMLFRLHQHA